MKATKKEPLLFTRRQILYVAGMPVAAWLLQACGGGGIGLGGGSSAISGTTVRVTFVLPAGVSASTLRCSTGWGSVTGLGSPVNVSVMRGNTTLLFVIDPSNGKVVMVGMVDDSASTHTIDATNIAATLIFLKMGGVQSPTIIRPNLWRLILLDPATAILATVVQTRLASDPYAIENQDPQLLSALQTAVSSLLQATIDGLSTGTGPGSLHRPAGKSLAPGRLYSPTAPPVPQTRNNCVLRTGDRTANDHPIFWDFVIQVNLFAREATSYIYELSQTDSSGVVHDNSPAVFYNGPTSVAPTNYSDPKPSTLIFDIPLKNPTDLYRKMSLITLAPVFDSPVTAPDPQYDPFVDTWRAAMPPMYQRAAVQIALFTFMEALSRGGAQISLAQLEQTTTRFSERGGAVQLAISNAGQGVGVVSSVNGIVDALLSTSDNQIFLLSVLNGLFGVAQNDVNLTLLRATYRLSQWIDILSQPGAELLHTCDGGGVFASQYQSVSVTEIDALPVIYKISTQSTGFVPGGNPVPLRLTDNDFEFLEPAIIPYRKYHWKLVGAGNATLSDGAGNTGREFETEKIDVTFNSTAASIGDQTITVTVKNLEFTSPVVTASASLILSPTTLQLLPNAPTLDPNAQQIFDLQHNDGSQFASGTTFRWTLTGTGSLGEESPVTTLTPTITYTAPNIPNQDSLMVEVFDNTGNSMGRITTVINVSTPSRVTPHNPYVLHNGTQIFTVAPLAGNYPTGSTYTWLLTGHGSIGHSNPVVTSEPQITYTAPSTDSNDTLTVTVKDASGKVVATAGTTITVANTQVVSPTIHWFTTNQYSGANNYVYQEYYGFAVFPPSQGAVNYVMHIVDPPDHSDSDVGSVTGALVTAGTPVWDPTQPLYENQNPLNYPIPYGGKQHPDYPTETGFYNAAGGIAWFIGGGQIGAPPDNFDAQFAQILNTQEQAAAACTFTVRISF